MEANRAGLNAPRRSTYRVLRAHSAPLRHFNGPSPAVAHRAAKSGLDPPAYVSVATQSLIAACHNERFGAGSAGWRWGYEGSEASAAMQLDEQDCNSNGSSPGFGSNAGRLSAEEVQLQWLFTQPDVIEPAGDPV